MKIALVCSHGGHLTELLYLMEAFEEHDIFFVTYDSPRTRALKYKKYLFPNFGERPLALIKKLPEIVDILVREKPHVIVSNGAEIAIPFFYLGKALIRCRTIFIESYTRVNSPTLTGKIVYPVSDSFFVLWPEMLAKYGKKAQYGGGIFVITNGVEEPAERTKRSGILVIVGMHYKGFERLVSKISLALIIFMIGMQFLFFAMYFDMEENRRIQEGRGGGE